MTHQHQVTCLEPFIMEGQVIDVVKNCLSTNTTSFIIGVNVLAISFHNTFGIFHIWGLTLMAVINVLLWFITIYSFHIGAIMKDSSQNLHYVDCVTIGITSYVMEIGRGSLSKLYQCASNLIGINIP